MSGLLKYLSVFNRTLNIRMSVLTKVWWWR